MAATAAVVKRIAEYCSEAGIDIPVDESARLVDLLDSLDLFQLILTLEDEYQVSLQEISLPPELTAEMLALAVLSGGSEPVQVG